MKHTDQAINIALAKAIGYRDEDIKVTEFTEAEEPFSIVQVLFGGYWQTFRHTSTSVIWPIAAKYDSFPFQTFDGKWWTTDLYDTYDTPELAVAMAVIELAGVKI